MSCRFQSNPGLEHWIVVKKIFKYLRSTKDLILTYEEGDLQLDGFTDFDFNQISMIDSLSWGLFLSVMEGQ